MKSVPTHLRQSVTSGRVDAVMRFGFTERQARFLVNVLVFSGVFIERQYRAFTGLAHGQKTADFLAKLVAAGYATPITPGALHRGRLFHVQYKPLYEAIGEPNNRNRRPASLGRFVERLMLLDAVLADSRHGWLGTEQDKRTYFREAFERDLLDDWYPHRTFGAGADKTVRFSPDKLPIGVPLRAESRHVFLYLATSEVPSEFRVFLLTHADLLKSVREWTIRVLLPRRFRKGTALYRYAVRDAFMKPLTGSQVEQLNWYFRVRHGEFLCPSRDRELDFAALAQTFAAGHYQALYRVWQQRGRDALSAMQIDSLREHLQRGWGRLEFVDVARQYLQLTPFLGTAHPVEQAAEVGDNLGIA